MLCSFSLRMHFIYPSLGLNGILQYENHAFDQVWKNLQFFPIVLAHPLYLYCFLLTFYKIYVGTSYSLPHFSSLSSIFFRSSCCILGNFLIYMLSLLIISIALTAWFNPIGAIYFLWFLSFLIDFRGRKLGYSNMLFTPQSYYWNVCGLFPFIWYYF